MNQASAVAVGVLISLMLQANGELQTAFGAAWSLLIIHAVGTLALVFVLFVRRASFEMKEDVPLYLYSAGALGVLLVFFNNAAVSSIGLTLTIALGVVGQLVTSSVVDRYGLFGLARRRGNPRKIVGFVLILAGIAVMTGN